jgi:hypothetical protein
MKFLLDIKLWLNYLHFERLPFAFQSL